MLVGYAAYLLVGVWLLLAPFPSAPSAGVGRIQLWLHAAGFGSIDAATAEFFSNVGLFVPLTFAVPWLVPAGPGGFGALRVSWGPRLLREASGWLLLPAAAFLASTSVEVIQALLLPDRSSTVVDIVANTLGGALGTGAAWLVLTDRKRAPRPVPADRRPRPWMLLVPGALVLVVLTSPPAQALAGRWAALLADLAERGWPGLLTDVGGWRMAVCALGFAVLAVPGTRVRPGWSATVWAGVGAAAGAVVALLDDGLWRNTSAVLSLTCAAAAGSFLGAWGTRAHQSPSAPEISSPTRKGHP